jgi:hypothetical protein
VYAVGGIFISSLFTVNSPSLALTVNETINAFGGLTTATGASAFFSQYTGSNDQLNPIGTTTNNGFSWSFQGVFDNKPLDLEYTGTLTSLDPTTSLLSWTGNGTYNGFNYNTKGNITFFATINGLNIDFTSSESDDLLLSNGSDFFRQTYTLEGIGNLAVLGSPVNSQIVPFFLGGGQAGGANQQQSGSGNQTTQQGQVNVSIPMTLNLNSSKKEGQNGGQQDRTTSTPSTIVTESKTATVELPNCTKTTYTDFKQTTKIPEPSSILGILALGTLGAASTLKRKLKSSQSTKKETTKVG